MKKVTYIGMVRAAKKNAPVLARLQWNGRRNHWRVRLADGTIMVMMANSAPEAASRAIRSYRYKRKASRPSVVSVERANLSFQKIDQTTEQTPMPKEPVIISRGLCQRELNLALFYAAERSRNPIRRRRLADWAKRANDIQRAAIQAKADGAKFIAKVARRTA